MIKVLIFNGKKQLASINFRSTQDFENSKSQLKDIFFNVYKCLLQIDEINDKKQKYNQEFLIEYMQKYPAHNSKWIASKFGLDVNYVYNIRNVYRNKRNKIKKEIKKQLESQAHNE